MKGIIALLIGLAAMVVGGYGCGSSGQEHPAGRGIRDPGLQTVAWVNGEPITAAEFQLYMNAGRAEVFRYFRDTYGTSDQKGFWEKDFGGEIPLERLRRIALGDAVADKLVQLAARDQGIAQDITHDRLLTRWREENDRRKEAIRQNRVIYGPEQYEIREYAELELGNLAAELKKKLAAAYKEEDLEEFYSRNRDSFYAEGSREIQRITVAYPVEAEAEARKRMSDIRSNVSDSTTMEQLLQGSDSIQVKEETLIMDSRTGREIAMRSPSQFDALQKLSPGDAGQLVEEERQLVLLRIVGQEEGGFVPFERVRESIRMRLADDEYRRRMDKRKAEAQVHIVESVYESIPADSNMEGHA